MKVSEKLKKDIRDYMLFHSLPDPAFDCVDRLEDIDPDDPMEAIYQTLDDSLIYYDDQWEVLQWACDPVNANWQDAFDKLCDYIYEGVMRALRNYKENEEDEVNVK